MPLVDPVTMAASQAKPAAPQPSKARDAAAALHPIHLHATQAAQTGRYVQPAALSGLFLLQFSSLVEDPVRTLSNTLPLVAVIQIAYALVCLPVAGSQAAKVVKKPKPGEKKKQDNTGPNPYIGLFLSLLLTALLTPVLHLAFVLFGAPFLTHIPHTLLVSANLALLALFPLFYVHGVDSSAWLAIGSALAPFDETFGGCAGALFGAWLGAIPIPLDWDREWQKWPVTILSGLYGGYLVGKLLGGSLLWGKRMTSKSVKEE